MHAHVEWLTAGIGHIRVYENGQVFEDKDDYVFHTILIFKIDRWWIQGADKKVTISIWKAIYNYLVDFNISEVYWKRKNRVVKVKIHGRRKTI